MGEREDVRQFVLRSLERLSDHAVRRYGLSPGMARHLACRILDHLARVRRDHPGLEVPPRLLLTVLHRWWLGTIAATAWPNLRTLCHAGVWSADRRRRNACRRAAVRLVRDEPTRPRFGPYPPASSPSVPEDWRNAVLAAREAVENPARSPWIHPEAGQAEETLSIRDFASPDPEVRQLALRALGSTAGLGVETLLVVYRVWRDDPEVSVRRAARALLRHRSVGQEGS